MVGCPRSSCGWHVLISMPFYVDYDEQPGVDREHGVCHQDLDDSAGRSKG